jgi:hypothetical protein
LRASWRDRQLIEMTAMHRGLWLISVFFSYRPTRRVSRPASVSAQQPFFF